MLVHDPRFEVAGGAARDHEPGHAGHAVDAVAWAQLAGRTHHDLAHRTEGLVRPERIALAPPAPVEAAGLLRHLVEALIVQHEAAARGPPARPPPPPPPALVLSEADVPALVLDDSEQELARPRVGSLRMQLEDRELHRLEDHVLGEDRGDPVALPHELEQLAPELEQAPARARFDLRVGMGDAELAQPG